VALTLDRDLTVVFLAANLLFAVAVALVAFRGRRLADRVLITLGTFLVLTVVSAAVLYLFAHTPVRDVDFFAVD
jgi:hypothetical protein